MRSTYLKLKAGFVSSSQTTEEFKDFFKVFKREFSKELRSIGATNLKFSRGHFDVSGFFTVNEKIFYFSLSDVRGFEYGLRSNPYSNMNQLLYRTAKDYKDFTGGGNQYVPIKTGMAYEMELN